MVVGVEKPQCWAENKGIEAIPGTICILGNNSSEISTLNYLFPSGISYSPSVFLSYVVLTFSTAYINAYNYYCLPYSLDCGFHCANDISSLPFLLPALIHSFIHSFNLPFIQLTYLYLMPIICQSLF